MALRQEGAGLIQGTGAVAGARECSTDASWSLFSWSGVPEGLFPYSTQYSSGKLVDLWCPFYRQGSWAGKLSSWAYSTLWCHIQSQHSSTQPYFPCPWYFRELLECKLYTLFFPPPLVLHRDEVGQTDRPESWVDVSSKADLAPWTIHLIFLNLCDFIALG